MQFIHSLPVLKKLSILPPNLCLMCHLQKCWNVLGKTIGIATSIVQPWSDIIVVEVCPMQFRNSWNSHINDSFTSFDMNLTTNNIEFK